MNTWLYPGWTQGNDNAKRREQTKCPNCGATDKQTDDDGHRTCWKCGTRWST